MEAGECVRHVRDGESVCYVRDGEKEFVCHAKD